MTGMEAKACTCKELDLPMSHIPSPAELKTQGFDSGSSQTFLLLLPLHSHLLFILHVYCVLIYVKTTENTGMRQSPTNMKFIDLEDNKQCKTNKN
jgi:hypothetical protein